MNFYSLYRIHNHPLRDLRRDVPRPVRRRPSRRREELIDTMPEALLRIPSPPMADFLEGYLSMKQHVLVRFGKWREIIAQELPEDRDLYCSTVGHDALRQGRGPFGAGRDRRGRDGAGAVPRGQDPRARDRRVHNNTVVDLLDVAEEMLNGELEYRRGNPTSPSPICAARSSSSDALPYDEPWGWMQPTRHALGALLLEQGRLARPRRSIAPISA